MRLSNHSSWIPFATLFTSAAPVLMTWRPTHAPHLVPSSNKMQCRCCYFYLFLFFTLASLSFVFRSFFIANSFSYLVYLFYVSCRSFYYSHCSASCCTVVVSASSSFYYLPRSAITELMESKNPVFMEEKSDESETLPPEGVAPKTPIAHLVEGVHNLYKLVFPEGAFFFIL